MIFQIDITADQLPTVQQALTTAGINFQPQEDLTVINDFNNTELAGYELAELLPKVNQYLEDSGMDQAQPLDEELDHYSIDQQQALQEFLLLAFDFRDSEPRNITMNVADWNRTLIEQGLPVPA